jgi:four helix bundle protein
VTSGEWLEIGGGQLPEKVTVKHYKELKIWQKSMALAKLVYRLTAKFPGAELYGLSSQLRRAAVSVPSNIAEGQSRTGTKEFLRSLSHASGSPAELETQILLSAELGYCGAADSEPILQEIAELQKMVAAIRRKLSVFSSH